ncbi:uncharacterized protein LOC106637955 [Copidosoma floridanum]|uniref:uncharacterized protein LOC106637955 n=1 Tax=Copidosoma floridanum TaxID=29053 RepID=UPI0006C9531F|nr:uncharacterized protein LOC106637955 [Copidosoma floridanum]
MTRCSRDAISLKSSVYNQTGQSYTNQVSLHRRMCMHFRRVIKAKCVVDARNPRFTRVLQKRAGGSCAARLRFSEDCCCQCPSEDTIDRLAYDTHHHPSEVIRAVCRSKSTSKERGGSECERCCQQVCPCGSAKLGFDCCGGAGVKGRLSRPRSRLDRSCTEYSPQQCFRYRKSNSCTRNGDAVGRSPSRQRCPGPLRRSSSFEDAADTFRDLAERKSDEVRYAKFIYDLTQEIVRKGLYTDRELNEVFQKHLDNNSQSLNKRKMLYEIYQLKISLGMSDDTEDEEEDELEADLVYAERFSKLRVPKPPTPPKVLNENKVIERLETYGGQQQHRNETSGSGTSSPAGCTRNVVLVDPNPELLVTETDVLTTLADECVDPEQIQRIYQNLCRRSKDAAALSKPPDG